MTPEPLRSKRPNGRLRRAATRAAVGGTVAATALGSLSSGGTAHAASAPIGSRSNPLTISANVATTTLDPQAEASVAILSVDSNLYSSLTTIGDSLKLTGDLATSWKQTSATTWDFRLRSDAKFWNGDPLNASAVVWNLSRVLKASNDLSLRTYYTAITSYKAISPTELQITTDGPDPNLARSLSFLYLLDPSWVAHHNPANDPMGSGPYRLVSYNPESTIALKANPTYYGTKPAFTYADYKVLTTDAARVNALESGEVDVSIILDPDDIAGLKKDKNLNVGAVPDTRLVYLKMNTLTGPLSNRDVRLALNYGVNKAAITKSVFNGWVKPTGEVLNPDNTDYDPAIKPFPYNPTLAKKLLAEAGHASGLTLEVDIPTGTYVAGDTVLQAVAAQLQQIGVTLTIDDMPFSTWSTKVNIDHDMTGMAYFGQAPQDNSSVGMLDFFDSTGSSDAYWVDPTFNKFVNALQHATSPAAEKKDIDDALIEMRAQAPILYLFNTPQTYAIAKGVSWKVRPDDWVRAYEMTRQ